MGCTWRASRVRGRGVVGDGCRHHGGNGHLRWGVLLVGVTGLDYGAAATLTFRGGAVLGGTRRCVCGTAGVGCIAGGDGGARVALHPPGATAQTEGGCGYAVQGYAAQCEEEPEGSRSGAVIQFAFFVLQWHTFIHTFI